jgi:hypothetical protein
MPEKPRPDAAGTTGPSQPAEAGQLQEDDRGNITWQWADEALLQDDTFGAVQRMRALVDPSLDIVEEGPGPGDIHNPQGLTRGYDPYDSGALGKKGYRRKKDLRELSKWIEQRRKAAGTADDGSEGGTGR